MRVIRYAKLMIVLLLASGFTGCICLNDTNNQSVFQFDEKSGIYFFVDCATETAIAGVGKLKRKGSMITLTDNLSDRKVVVTVDLAVKRGTVGVQTFSPNHTFGYGDTQVTQNDTGCEIPCLDGMVSGAKAPVDFKRHSADE